MSQCWIADIPGHDYKFVHPTLTDGAKKALKKRIWNVNYTRHRSEKRAYLIIGPPGSGKTTVARQIAKILRIDYSDVDDLWKYFPNVSRYVNSAMITVDGRRVDCRLTDVKQSLVRDVSDIIYPNHLMNAIKRGYTIVDQLFPRDGFTIPALLRAGYKIVIISTKVPMRQNLEWLWERSLTTGRFVGNTRTECRKYIMSFRHGYSNQMALYRRTSNVHTYRPHLEVGATPAIRARNAIRRMIPDIGRRVSK